LFLLKKFLVSEMQRPILGAGAGILSGFGRAIRRIIDFAFKFVKPVWAKWKRKNEKISQIAENVRCIDAKKNHIKQIE
jgi:hypothetical protein